MATTRPALVVLVLLAASPVQAQAPSGPPPPSSRRESAGPEVHELLPEIGRIGAQVGVFAGGSWNPYGVGRGLAAGGFIDLPLAKAPGGKLSYEILLALSLARSDESTILLPTFPPISQTFRTRLRLAQVSPFALKYTLTRWDHARLRPYLVAGVDVIVVATRDESAETADGPPSDAVGLEIGGHAGSGLEIRLSAGLSLNLDYRFTAFQGQNARLHTAGAALGFHW